MADVHANLPAAQAVVADIRRRGADRVYHLGDLVGYCPWPNETIEFIRSSGIACLQGNYDESVGEELLACGCDFADPRAAELGEISLNWTIDATTAENKAWLRSLPKEIHVDAGSHRLWLVHGSPRRSTEYLTPDFPAETLSGFFAAGHDDILCCAHTHLAYHRQLGDRHIINVGTSGKPKHGNPNVVYMLVDVGEAVTASLIEVAYDSESTAQRIEAVGLPSEFARIIRTGIA